MSNGNDPFFLVVKSTQFEPNCEWPYVDHMVFGPSGPDEPRNISLIETRDRNRAQGGHTIGIFRAWFPERVFDLEPRQSSQY